MFENLIGNEKIKQDLKTVLNNNKVSHSYMFIGNKGIGKSEFAKEFAKGILCTGSDNKPCLSCKSCVEFDNNNNPDFYYMGLGEENSIKIDIVRNMQKKVQELPIVSNKKVYIIDDAEYMTKEAQNCLLKTIEEPPEFVTVILITSNENRILNTIKSRCLKIYFNNIEDDLLKRFLSDKYKIDNISFNMLKSFDGSIGKALQIHGKEEKYKILDQVFNNKERYDCTFEETDIYKYMNTLFAKELFQTVVIQNKLPLKSDSEKLKKKNPYNFDFSNVTEEDIIRGMIESDISVFLHGMSGDGKSARVKQLDPDCEIIYLRNATPDSLNGKSVYDPTSGEMIDVQPTWYKKVCKKCEDEPDKIHIVFFDEITNALPSVQGMAFNIVLDGEVNGKWKLPENARIVAAGNNLTDSLSANTLSEPLFNRFAHVYINTTVDSWLKWAITPKQNYERLDYVKEEEHLIIHPAIYTYILYMRYCRHDALRTPYNGEKPNADPRKWEMASKVLYSTGRPEMLRALVGEDLTRNFVAFTNQKVITLEDVLKKNYSDEDLVMDLAEKYATVVGLSSVSFENVEEVRNFVIDNFEKEFIALFDNLWTRGDDERLERIAELKMQESTKVKKKIKRK